ncbi:MAG: RIP metalloprotease RseP [Candidatus Latescibacterota bacterium]|jgi:regulator of sigma E protease
MIGTIVSFIVALGVLVFVHELGHFLVAKRAGIRVERFSLGYPPKAWGFRYGETEYCISWIPFGGYVKVAGMADVGTEQTTGASWEFPSKPIWVRMAVIAAGPGMNFLFAFVALFALCLAYGIDTFEGTAVTPEAGSVAAQAGVQPGDEVVQVDGQPVSDAYGLLEALRQSGADGAVLQVRRDGERVTVVLPDAPKEGYGLEVMRPTTVGHLVPGMPAEALGLQPGDRIVAVAGQPVSNWAEMSREIRRYPDQSVLLAWTRGDRRLEAAITPAKVVEGEQAVGQIGIGPQATRHRVGVVAAAGLGLEGVYRSTYLIIDFLGQLFQGERSTEELGGPLRIAQLAGQTAEQGLNHFISFLAMLSVNLAIINLLPIPVLDGGHLFFLSLEGLMHRPLSVRQREVFQQIGLVIMLGIMVLVTFNDLNQMVFDHIRELFQ